MDRVQSFNYAGMGPIRNPNNYVQEAMNSYREMQLPRWLSGKQKALDLTNQLLQTRNQFLPQLAAERLQGLGLGNQMAQTQLQYLPKLLQGKLTSEGLGNQLLAAQVQAVPQLMALKEALAKAQLSQASMPTFSSPIGKMLQDYIKASQQYGPDSPEAKILSSVIGNAQQGGAGTISYSDPLSGQNYTVSLGSPSGKGGAPMPVTLPDGTTLSGETTAATTKLNNQQNSNLIRELMANSPLFNMPNRYIGPGGSNKFAKDMQIYNDPNTPMSVKQALRPQITQAAVANQAVYELTAKTLQGLGLNAGVTMVDDLKKSLTTQWPDFGPILSKYAIPNDIAVDTNNLVRNAPSDLGAGLNQWNKNGRPIDSNGYPITQTQRIYQEFLPPGVTPDDVTTTAQKYKESPLKVIQTIYDLQNKKAGI